MYARAAFFSVVRFLSFGSAAAVVWSSHDKCELCRCVGYCVVLVLRVQLTLVRGKGLLNAVVVKPRKAADGTEVTAWDVCVAMANRGVLAKPTHKHIIRLAPPLVITEEQVKDAVHRIDQAFVDCGM